MGCIIGSLASSVACCFCGSAASLCCGCLPSCKSSTASRIMYGVILLFGTVLSAICLAPGLRDALSKIPALCQPVQIIGIDTKIVSGFNCELLVGYGAVYRFCFAMACFFFLFCIIMIRVHSSQDPRAKIQNGFWFFKFLILIGIMVGAFFIPLAGFTTAWMVIGMIGGFLFIIIQLIMIIDFAHAWNAAWIGEYEETNNRAYCCGLVFFTLLFYCLSIAAIVCLYVFYAADASCGLNKFFISINLILCVLISVISVLPKVQERLPNSGILQSSLMTIYVTYLTWSAMSNEPNVACNPMLNQVQVNYTKDGQKQTAMGVRLEFNWHIVVGLVIFFITVIYSSIRNSGHTAAGKLTMSGTENTELADKSDGPSGDHGNEAQQVWDNEEEGVAYDYSMFHALMFLGSLYIMMTLTSWYSPEGSDLVTLYANMASTWVKMVSSWMCLALYLWTLIAPILLPDREFT